MIPHWVLAFGLSVFSVHLLEQYQTVTILSFLTDFGINSCDWSFGLPSSRSRCQVTFAFLLQGPIHYTGGIWKRIFSCEKAFYVFCPHYAGEIENVTIISYFRFVFEKNLVRKITWRHREHTILLSRERVNKGTKRMNSLPLSPVVIS